MPDLAALLPALGAGQWALLALGALVVGVSKTALPGAGTIAVGLFALALPAKESTAALLALLILGDAMALWLYRRHPDWRTLVRLIPSVLLGVVIGTVFLGAADGDVVRRAIGLILLALIAVTLWRRRRARAAGSPAPSTDDEEAPPSRSPRTVAARAGFGLLGGFTTMVANAGGPVMALYFTSMRLPVLTFLGTSAWFFAVVNVLKLPFSAGLGLFSAELIALDVMLVPLVLLGGAVGWFTAKRISQRRFERIVLVLTVVSAVGLLLP